MGDEHNNESNYNTDKYGGSYGNVESADYLFSDNAFQEDTRMVYEQVPGISIFQTGWITEVINSHTSCYDVPVGKYFLPAHFITGLSTGFTTPERRPPSLPPRLKTTSGRISLRAKGMGYDIRHAHPKTHTSRGIGVKGESLTPANTVSVPSNTVSPVGNHVLEVDLSSDYVKRTYISR